MRNQLAVLAILGVLAACYSTSEPSVDGPEGLAGSWRAVRSCGGFAGGCSAPRVDETWMFQGRDSLRVFTGIDVARYRIRVVQDTATIYGNHDLVQRWDDGSDRWVPLAAVLELAPDSLVLGDNLYDGYSTTLKRVVNLPD